NLSNNILLVLAVTLHNIPEGMAVGVVLASFLNGTSVSYMQVIALTLGIALQNFPEGAIISLPLKVENKSNFMAFVIGSLTGIVEPIAGMVTILLSRYLIMTMPYLLAFAAGAMMYVVVEELIPEANMGKHSNIATIGFALGFIVMMILDTFFG
ncbi:MAG: ZIP family metal transporter, partial [Erysipelotrichaceae bacterium]|nr:ZIP family metal transporter [Erysipelotrichaceae bacterium]